MLAIAEVAAGDAETVGVGDAVVIGGGVVAGGAGGGDGTVAGELQAITGSKTAIARWSAGFIGRPSNVGRILCR
jgi:hypothetical protein